MILAAVISLGLAAGATRAEITPPPPTDSAPSSPDVSPPGPANSNRQAVARALPLIAASAKQYTQKRKCFTCHHQALPLMAMAAAQRAGHELGNDWTGRQADFTLAYFNKRRERVAGGAAVPGGPYTAGYALVGLAEVDRRSGPAVAALGEYLLKTQHKDGSWRIGTHRPPLEDSHFAATALAVRGLSQGPPRGQDATAATAIKKARMWLQHARPETNEDATFQLLGLVWADAGQDAIAAAKKALIARQRADGGWAQIDGRPSDAYATGQAVAALLAAGQSPKSRSVARGAIERGRAWLRSKQQDDGSWRVTSRSKPIQVYFESGYPHGRDQFISIAAACWAVMALSEENEPESRHAR